MYDEQTKAKLNTSKDYYYILGVRPDATTEEITEAYHDLHDKFGPHVNLQGHDPDLMIKTFKDISDAYEVLTDPQKRKEYDRASVDKRQSASELRALLVRRTPAPAPAPAPAQNLSSGPSPKTSFTNIPAIPDAERNSKIQPLALEMEIEVTLREAIKGASKELVITDPTPCECFSQRTGSKMQCQRCGGMGYTKLDRKQLVDLPAGMFDNMEVRLPDQGRFDLRVGRNGDLIARIKLKPHPLLRVLGRDVTITIPVTIYEAVLGSEIEVPCATGKVVMKIQPLTQSGRVYRLKGLGLAGADQLVTIEVVIPQVLDAEEVQLYRKLKQLSREPNPRESLFKQVQPS